MNQTLLLTSGSSLFGLAVKDVAEVLDPRPVYPVPRAPSWVLGAVGRHDRVLPVIDLACLHGTRQGGKGQIVVLDGGRLSLAVTVVHGLTQRGFGMPGALHLPWVVEMFICSRGLAGLIDPGALTDFLKQRLLAARCFFGDSLAAWEGR